MTVVGWRHLYPKPKQKKFGISICIWAKKCKCNVRGVMWCEMWLGACEYFHSWIKICPIFYLSFEFHFLVFLERTANWWCFPLTWLDINEIYVFPIKMVFFFFRSKAWTSVLTLKCFHYVLCKSSKIDYHFHWGFTAKSTNCFRSMFSSNIEQHLTLSKLQTVVKNYSEFAIKTEKHRGKLLKFIIK